MSGRCYGCGNPFKKFFSGEKGCKNCGFEFCKKCVVKKIAIPKLNGEQHYVCDKCFEVISSGVKPGTKRPLSPPRAHVKRLEALEDKATGQSKVSVRSSSPLNTSGKAQKNYGGMEPADADLARRLDKLKEDRLKITPRPDIKEIESRLADLKADKPEPPTEQEMRERLAKLQGKDTKPQETQYFGPEKRHEEEQIVDLMDELFSEHQIEQQHEGMEPPNQLSFAQPQRNDTSNSENIDIEEINALIKKTAKELELDAENALFSLQQDKQLMARLKELKKKESAPKDTTDSVDIQTMDNGDSDNENNEDDDDALAGRLIKQYLEEAKLEEATARSNAQITPSTNTKKDDAPEGKIPEIYKPQTEAEEFPWCCICNEDAKIKCFDCEGDLYCAPCFGQAHKESIMKDHDFERYPRRN